MQKKNISPANLENCVKCNLCTEVCPMYAVNPLYPGPKNAGPDGERYRLANPEFFDSALKYCLNCKRCEVVCPSGVKVGDMISVNRLEYYKSDHALRDWMLSSTDLVGTLATTVSGIVNPVLGWKVSKTAMDAVLGVSKERQFPKYARQKFVPWFRRNAEKVQEGFSRHVNFFHGCNVNYNDPSLGMAFVSLMNACGYGVKLLDKEKCCGVALIANALKDKATRQAKINLESFRKASGDILTVSSTCTFTMRDEYAEVLGLDNSDVRDSIVMTVKWLYDKVDSGEIKLAFKEDFRMKAAYHIPCHMQRLGWQYYSIGLLRMIPGLDLTVMPQNCCGMAGTFGFKKENYEFSKKMFAPVHEEIQKIAPEVVITDCETCKWQIEGLAGVNTVNPILILAQALDHEKTAQLNCCPTEKK